MHDSVHPIRHRGGLIGLSLLAAIAAIAGLVGVGPGGVGPANATPVYGGVQLVDLDGDPVAGAAVVIGPSTDVSQRLGWWWTGSDGVGTVPSNVSGEIEGAVRVARPYQLSPATYYGWTGASILDSDEANATAVAVFSASSDVLLDLVLPIDQPEGSIRGTVTLGSSTSGAEQAEVDLYEAGSGDWIAWAVPEADGTYEFPHLPAGSYKLQYLNDATSVSAPSGYATRWYRNATTLTNATVVTLADGQVLTGIDQSLHAAHSFTDVPYDSQFADEISWLADSGVTTGYPDGTFRPLGTVNRDAMAAFLYRFAGSPEFTPPAVSPFSDVPTSSQFYTEIAWLADSGVSTGYPDGTFRPLGTVNRDAMAAFLYRFAGSPTWTAPPLSPFSDVAEQSQFYPEVTWLSNTGITTGYPDGTYRPLATVNRDAMAAFLFRFDSAAR
jgi:hypothetical protein